MNTKKQCLFPCFIFLLLLKITNAIHCAPSSCGNLLNITHPFRLKSDPRGCGDSRYELSCESNSPIIYFPGIGKFNVISINYVNYTLRLVDPAVDKDDCYAIPSIPVSEDILSNSHIPYRTARKPNMFGFVENIGTITYVKCRDPVNSPAYLDRSPCINGVNLSSDLRIYNYAYQGELAFHDLGENCSIEMVSVFPIRDSTKKTSSFVEIQTEMAYGFELYWYKYYCEKLDCSDECILDNSNKIVCFTYQPAGIFKSAGYAYEDWRFMIEQFFRTHFDMEFALLQIKTSFRANMVHPLYQILYTLNFFGVFLILRNICGAPFVFAFLIYKWRRRHLSGYNSIEEFLQSQNNLMPIRYKFSDIKKMSSGFKDKLGKGGFGSVYKGKLRSGQLVAIKMLDNPKANGQDFINEVATIGRIHHANVVQVVGFCCERSKFALIYEFMPNRSLDYHIASQQGISPLSWEKLYEISIGVARGIEYLHQGCEMQILHFDIKPHNILLDENFAPKLSDFGLAKFHQGRNNDVSLTAAKGTIGYMAPELFYKNIGGISYKADVYSFGMLLLEMTGKRKNLSSLLDNSGQSYYSNWVFDQLFNGNPSLEDTTKEDNEIARKLIIIGLWCIQMQPANRPPMNKVVEMLEEDSESLQLPPRPLLYPTESIQPTDTELSMVSSHDFTELYENDVRNAESSSLIQNIIN